MNQGVENQEAQIFDFAQMLPNLAKLFTWLLYACGSGMFIFPFIALTIDVEFAIHFWVLTGLNFGMLITLLIFRSQISTLDQKQEIKKEK